MTKPYRYALAALLVVAVLLCGVRSLWMQGFYAGADAAECIDLFTMIGTPAADAGVCKRASYRFRHDPLARIFANEAELKFRREQGE